MPEEDISFDNVNICLGSITIVMVFSSFLEMLAYFRYNNKVFTKFDPNKN